MGVQRVAGTIYIPSTVKPSHTHTRTSKRRVAGVIGQRRRRGPRLPPVLGRGGGGPHQVDELLVVVVWVRVNIKKPTDCTEETHHHQRTIASFRRRRR